MASPAARTDQGETMSKPTTNAFRRRLALLASSSFALAVIAGGSAVLTPGQARALDDCGNPDANTTGADTFTCSGPYPTGIVYPDTNGNLTLNLASAPNGALVVSNPGILVTGTGANTITINRTDTGGVGDPQITSTSGPGLSVSGGSGITVNLTDPDANSEVTPMSITGTTHGVRMQTTGSGSFFSPITMTFTQTNGTITATGPTGIGLEAISTATGSAATNITLNVGGLVTGATGVRAETNGIGAMTVTLNAPTATVGGGQVVGGEGPAIELDPNLNVTLAMQAGTVARADGDLRAVVDVANLNGSMTFTNAGTLRANDAAAVDGLIFAVGGGAGLVTMTNGQAATNEVCPGFGLPCIPGQPAVGSDLRGRMDLNNTGTTTLNLNQTSIWRTAGASLLGDGNTTLAHGAQAVIFAGDDGMATTLDFGGGTDTYNQAGLLSVGGGTEAAALLTLSDLSRWNLSGSVLFGADGTSSDGVANDVIIADGTTFNGTGGAQLVMDVDLSGTQLSCGNVTAGDCLSLVNGSTQGSTSILINSIGAPGGAYNPNGVVIVDVSGTGASSAEHFELDPATVGYLANDELGGIIDQGLFFADLAYNPDTQQHLLVGLPKRETLQLATLGTASQTLWHLSTGAWFDRQADLRNTIAGRQTGASPGAWVKLTGNVTDRDLDQSFDNAGVHYRSKSGYDLVTTLVSGGVDLVYVDSAAQSFVAGVAAGLIDSEMEFKTSPTLASFEGHSLGAYATYVGGMFFIDGIVNTTSLDAEFESAALGLPAASRATGTVESRGAQVEGGVRLPVNDGAAYFEPLLALSYSTTDISDFALPGATFSADDLVSVRGSVGARLSGDLVLDTFTAKMGLTGRVWEEFEGENELIVETGAASLPLFEELSGTISEVLLDVSVEVGSVSAFVNGGIKFAEDYKSSGGSVGVRYQW